MAESITYAKENSESLICGKQDHIGSWMQSLSPYGSGVSMYGARDENGTILNQPSSVTVAELIVIAVTVSVYFRHISFCLTVARQ